MYCLVRKQAARSGSQVEYFDTEVEADVVRLGSGSDQDIVLASPGVLENHLEIQQQSNGALRFVSVSGQGVSHNDEPVDAGELSAGDHLQIGSCILKLLTPPHGFDAAFQIECGAVPDEAKLLAEQLHEISAQGPSLRQLSWTSGILILLVFLIAPLATLFDQDVADFMRSSGFFPSDHLWDTGDLIEAHQIPELINDCNVCHATPFVMVENNACAECHQRITHHAEPETDVGEELAARRCASCHKEHKEPHQIVRQDDGLCVDCHADPVNLSSGGELKSVSNFVEQHPDFRMSPLVFSDDAGEWMKHRLEAAGTAFSEQSNLAFPHDVHLDAEGIESPEGDVVLQCADCHQPDASGKNMQPVRMEAHCRSCHRLEFDETDPDREVPHGKPALVLKMLEEFYSKYALDKRANFVEVDDDRRVPRRPGIKMSRQDAADVIATAQQEALKTGEYLFERSVCSDCHEVIRQEQDGTVSWEVVPVQLNDDWLPASAFNHASHAFQACDSCHDAADSTESQDVLMPAIDNCRACHGDTRSADVRSNCVTCHVFHASNKTEIFLQPLDSIMSGKNE